MSSTRPPSGVPAGLRRQRARLPRLGFWLMNRTVNPVVRAVLSSPAHRVFGRAVGLITVPGRRTGRDITLPVMYTRVNERVVIHPGAAAHKTWWRNISPEGTPVRLRLAGNDERGLARTVFDGDRVTVEVTPGDV